MSNFHAEIQGTGSRREVTVNIVNIVSLTSSSAVTEAVRCSVSLKI